MGKCHVERMAKEALVLRVGHKPDKSQ